MWGNKLLLFLLFVWLGHGVVDSRSTSCQVSDKARKQTPASANLQTGPVSNPVKAVLNLGSLSAQSEYTNMVAIRTHTNPHPMGIWYTG